MTILEALTEANIEAGITTPLQFADLQEFNSFIDSFAHATYPLNVVAPISISGTFTSNQARESLNLNGWVVTRLSQDTNNFRTKAIEDSYINPMRILARKFLLSLLDTDIIEYSSSSIDVSYTINPEYRFLSAHVFGVSYTARIPILSNIC